VGVEAMFPRLSPAIRLLIIANVLIFGGQILLPQFFEYYFALHPLSSQESSDSAHFALWQLITYGFLHASVTHIFFNMFALFMFGSDIERSMGQRKFLVYYFVCIVGAGLTQLLVMAIGITPPADVVGASGAVFGILLAFAIAFPHRRLIVLPIPIPMPAWLFVTLYSLLELYLGIFQTQQGVAHFAHLGGAAAGYLLIVYWRYARHG
ncbi:MAG TPA: rhomboid family intramembrane serine protease, partial [Steroidobacteraceae bacterium]|nr:rhomboid family intramembrane serine protease [Steroidobacteraceae bacterium]